MNKAVMISIRPEWCELIASGKKRVEVRKTRPKLETPFKCYIYCTNTPKYHHLYNLTAYNDGKPLYSVTEHNKTSLVPNGYMNGKVIGEFVCDDVEMFSVDYRGNAMQNKRISELSCVPLRDLIRYQGEAYCLYGWHISDLVIYDEPKVLSGFIKHDYWSYDEWVENTPWHAEHTTMDYTTYLDRRRLTRPPQSWCYVEVSKEINYENS